MSIEKKRIGLNLLAGLWCVIIASSFAALESYKARSGDFGNQIRSDANETTPFETATTQAIEQPQRGGEIAVFIHPRCPCTRATLTELAHLVPSIPSNTQLRILLIRPVGVDSGWEESDIVNQARLIPGATVCKDDEGQFAKRHGVKTSGHVVYSDARGNVLYSGGITRARGHEGESTGGRLLKEAFLGASRSSKNNTVTNSVFGCPLLAEESGAQ